MDESETELLKLLYTRIGMEMEDASIIAIELGAPSSTFDRDKASKLSRTVEKITALADAVQSIAE